MKGRRLYTPDYMPNDLPDDTQSGDYWTGNAGDWHGITPNGLFVWLKNHKVIEHEDGTISVLPPDPGETANSILANNGMKQWHGYIKRGVWEEC